MFDTLYLEYWGILLDFFLPCDGCLGEIINVHGSRMFGNATTLKQATN
jgi:hypothetical protein